MPDLFDERPCLTVSELVSQIKDHVEPAFPNVWVAGEISECKRAATGHIYLTLKDATSQLRAAIWRFSAYRLKFEPKAGMEVIAHGKIDIWQQGGSLTFSIDHLEPKGVGAAELALRQLKEKLQKKGYFAKERKRPLPEFPTRIGIISSATGAAVRDILELLAKRWPRVEVVVRHSAVQGAGAGEMLAEAVRELSELHRMGALAFDAIIVGRGGGSVDDLAAFNDETLADAIFVASMPVVSAVGHEIDTSIADLVADARAETPSHAVTLLTPDRTELAAGILNAATRLRSAALAVVNLRTERLKYIESRPAFRKPYERLLEREQRIDELTSRLTRAATVRLTRAKEALAFRTGRLEGLSPLNVLTRGYSLTTKNGHVVRDAKTLTTGDELTTRLASGEVVSTVTSTQHSTLNT
jgi:exodeoxyribonuclease VII large subunit